MNHTDKITALRDALTEAFNYGQTYWQQADSESIIQNKRSDATSRKFEAFVDETCAALTADASEDAPDRVDPVVEANRALLHERSQFGIKKYGVTLHEARYSERELLVHALQESLDLANYLQANLQRVDAASPAPVAATPAPDVWALIDAYADLRAEYAHSTARHLAKTQCENVEHAKAELASAIASIAAAQAAPIAEEAAVAIRFKGLNGKWNYSDIVVGGPQDYGLAQTLCVWSDQVRNAAPVGVASELEQFEAWALTSDGNCNPENLCKWSESECLLREDVGAYKNETVQRDWEVWQARGQQAGAVDWLDAVRLNWLISNEFFVQQSHGMFSVRWPITGERESGDYPTAQEAIDAAMQPKAPA